MSMLKVATLFLAICCFTSLNAFFASNDKTQTLATNGTPVRYTFVSQRWLTKDELRQFDDAFGFVLAVRMRLSNEGSESVYYLADGNGSIRPQGYQFFRKMGEPKWNYSPPSRGREGAPGTEFTGSQYTYLILPPSAAIEFEMFDWSHSGEEHAFTTFVKTDVNANPVEIVSDTFRPFFKK